MMEGTPADENHETGQIQAKGPSGEGRRPKWRKTKPPSGEG